MDFENQYNSPETPIIPEKTKGFGNLTEIMMSYLKETSPWIIFVAVLGFITCGFIAVGSVITTIGLLTVSNFLSEIGNFPIWLVVPLYIAAGLLLFFPSYFMYNAGTKIRKHQYSNADEDLEQALKNNKSLWKYFGIMSIISLSVIPVSLIIIVVFTIISAFQVS